MNINNNIFELKPTNSKRKVAAPCPNVFLNPALDLLANEDRMCNTKMEVIPVKKRKRTRSCEIAAFENSGLDLGISKAAVNEFLIRELDNVRKNVRVCDMGTKTNQNPNILDHNINKITDNVQTNAKTSNLYDASPILLLGNRNSMYNILESKSQVISADFNIKTTDIPPALLPRAEITKNSSLPNITFNDINLDPIYANTNEVPLRIANVNNKELAKGNNSKIFNTTEEVVDSNVDNTNKLETNDTVNIFDLNSDDASNVVTEPIYANLTEASNNFRSQMETITNNDTLNPLTNISEMDSGISESDQRYTANDLNISAITNIQTTVTNQYFVNNSNMSLSFIDRLALDSPNTSNQSLYLDDDLNESNIMEIKTITIITKKKRIEKKNTNPFLQPDINEEIAKSIDIIPHNIDNTNPFIDSKSDELYNDGILNRPIEVPTHINIIPRQLFTETNSTISTVNESMLENHYENVSYRAESPIYENLDDPEPFNKQSKILGHDVSKFSAVDIMNLNKNNQTNSSLDSNDSKKYLKQKIVKASNKLSKKVFKTLKKTFKSEKDKVVDTTLNPYEVPRKPPKQKIVAKDSGIENPALNLDNSDEIEIEEIEDEPQYETIKTMRNTRLNMNVTPLKERAIDNIDISNSRITTPGKKVRFDSTLNREKIITGDSFDCDLQSPGFDSKIDKYHDELENCINERKFLQQM